MSILSSTLMVHMGAQGLFRLAGFFWTFRAIVTLRSASGGGFASRKSFRQQTAFAAGKLGAWFALVSQLRCTLNSRVWNELLLRSSYTAHSSLDIYRAGPDTVLAFVAAALQTVMVELLQLHPCVLQECSNGDGASV